MKPVGYGNRLICVRYRYHSERQRRIKTVELIEEEQPWCASGALYLVKIGRDEAALRERLQMAGARWLPDRKLWKPQEPLTRHLGLEERLITWLSGCRIYSYQFASTGRCGRLRLK